MLSIIFIVSVILELLVVQHLANAYISSPDSPSALYEEGFQVLGPYAGRPGSYQELAGIGTNAAFNGIRGIALDRTEKFAILGSADGKKIRKMNLQSQYIGGDITPNHDWHYPMGVVVSQSNTAIYVSDRHCIARINNFNVNAVAGTEDYTVDEIAGYIEGGFVDGDGAVARFFEPRYIDIDKADKFLYVSDIFNKKIRRVNLKSASYSVDTFYTSETELGAIVLDSRDSFLYVASFTLSGILRVSVAAAPVAMFLTAYNTDNGRLVDGPLKSSKFLFPTDIAIDELNNLYIVDNWYEVTSNQFGQEEFTYSAAIRRVDTKKGLTSTIAGTIHSESERLADGTGSSAIVSNNFPWFAAQVAVSKNGGKILLTDYDNNIIREVSCVSGYNIGYGQCAKSKVKEAATKKPTKQ